MKYNLKDLYYQPDRESRECRMQEILEDLLILKDADGKHVNIPYLSEIMVLYTAAENCGMEYRCPIDGVLLSEDFNEYTYVCGKCGRYFTMEELEKVQKDII